MGMPQTLDGVEDVSCARRSCAASAKSGTTISGSLRRRNGIDVIAVADLARDIPVPRSRSRAKIRVLIDRKCLLPEIGGSVRGRREQSARDQKIAGVRADLERNACRRMREYRGGLTT